MSASAVTLKMGGHLQDTYKKPFQLYVDWAAAQTGADAYTVTTSLTPYNEDTMAADVAKMTTVGDGTYVDVLICPYGSTLVKACVDAVNKDYEGPVFGWGGASDAIFDTNFAALPNNNGFGLLTVGTKYFEGGLQALASKGAAQVATISNNNGFSTSLAKGANATVLAETALTQQSDTTLSVAKADLAASDTTAIAAALAMKPDIVVIAGHNKDVEPVIVQIGKSSHMPKAILATNGLTVLANYGSDSKYASCVMMPTQWDFTSSTNDTVLGWDSAAFTTAMGGAATYQQAAAGGVVVAIANAMKTANNNVTTLVATLSAMDVDSFYGKLKWDAGGRIQKPMYTQQKQGDNMVIVMSDMHYPLSLSTCWGDASTTGDGDGDANTTGDGATVTSGVLSTTLSAYVLANMILVKMLN